MGGAHKHAVADRANSNAKRTRATYHSGLFTIRFCRTELDVKMESAGPAREDPCKTETIGFLLRIAAYTGTNRHVADYRIKERNCGSQNQKRTGSSISSSDASWMCFAFGACNLRC